MNIDNNFFNKTHLAQVKSALESAIIAILLFWIIINVISLILTPDTTEVPSANPSLSGVPVAHYKGGPSYSIPLAFDD